MMLQMFPVLSTSESAGSLSPSRTSVSSPAAAGRQYSSRTIKKYGGHSVRHLLAANGGVCWHSRSTCCFMSGQVMKLTEPCPLVRGMTMQHHVCCTRDLTEAAPHRKVHCVPLSARNQLMCPSPSGVNLLRSTTVSALKSSNLSS